jgi:hypothetical protein
MYSRARNVGGTTEGVALSSLVDERVFCCADLVLLRVCKERCGMCFAPANPQKETLIRRLTTGGATA